MKMSFMINLFQNNSNNIINKSKVNMKTKIFNITKCLFGGIVGVVLLGINACKDETLVGQS